MKTTMLLKTGLCASMALVAWTGTPAAFAMPAAPAASAAKSKVSAAPAMKASSASLPGRAASTLGGGGTHTPTRPTGTASAVTQ